MNKHNIQKRFDEIKTLNNKYIISTKNEQNEKLYEHQLNSILDVLYAYGIFHMRIMEYISTASTCHQWHNTLVKNHYVPMLRAI